jgi:glycosyltransferase involved in cell wall biosynthesis
LNASPQDLSLQDQLLTPASSSRGPGKRVMLIASHAPSLIIFRSHLIRALVSRGHDVLCLAPDFSAEVRAHVLALGAKTADYPLSRRGLNPVHDLKSLRALLAQMRSFRPDVVMGYTPKPAIYGAIAARLARVPRIIPMITGLGYAFLGSSRRDRTIQFVSKQLYARALRSSHSAIFHNKDDQRQLLQNRVIPAGLPTHVVGGSGIDLTAFSEMPLPATTNGLTFLMIARLLKYKGVIEFCEAAREVRKSSPTARFVLVGPEEPGPGGLTAAHLAQWQDCVAYVGPQADVRSYLAQCHVFVLPSYDGEGLPRTVLEAMAIGRPIITTDARGCRETVDERVNGCLVPVGDANALAEAMNSFLRRPDQLTAMARASRQKAVRMFDVEIVTRDMLAILLNPEKVSGLAGS